ncbi:MAG: hypothetical protein HWD60_06725 [Defluviicoccus sp.]|nr:MAG: hypothetical protein HWD60_06725 [Defluviicoccus sp.]
MHLLANGDAAGMILFGGITLLALVGARAQDVKRRGQLGAAWNTYAAQTRISPSRPCSHAVAGCAGPKSAGGGLCSGSPSMGSCCGRIRICSSFGAAAVAKRRAQVDPMRRKRIREGIPPV